MQLLANGKQQFIDQNGLPLANGSVYFYAPGTTNPLTTYQDAAGTIANTNPIQLDSRGQAIIWGSSTYRQVVRDASGLTIWDQVVAAAVSALDLSGVSGASLIGLPDGTKLSDLLTTSFLRVVDSISALRALNHTFYQRAFVTGYYAPHDGGGGSYQYDASDTTTADNGGTVIVASDGGRWKLASIGPLSVKQFGAKGDGTTVDTTAIAAFFAAIAGKKGVFPPGKYVCNAPISIPDGTTFDLEMQAATLDFSAATVSGEGMIVIGTDAASLTTLPTLSTAINKGDATFTLSGSPALVPGDLYILWNDADYSWLNISGRNYYKQGEFCRVKAVSGSIVTNEKESFDTYATTNIKVSKLTTNKVRIRGNGKMIFPSTAVVSGIVLFNGYRSEFEGLELTGADHAQIDLRRCFETRVIGCNSQDYGGDVGLNYGVSMIACFDCHVGDSSFHTTRHGITLTGGNVTASIPNRFCTVHDCTVSGDLVGLDMHGANEHCGFYDNIVYGSINIGGDNITVRGGKVFSGRNTASRFGTCIVGREMLGANVTIEDVELRIMDTVLNGTDAPIMVPLADQYSAVTGLRPGNIRISGIKMVADVATTIAARISIPATSVGNVKISVDGVSHLRPSGYSPLFRVDGNSGGYFESITLKNLDGVVPYLGTVSAQRIKVANVENSNSPNFGAYINVVSAAVPQRIEVVNVSVSKAMQAGMLILGPNMTDDIIATVSECKSFDNNQNGSSTTSRYKTSIAFESLKTATLKFNTIGDTQATATQTTYYSATNIGTLTEFANEPLGNTLGKTQTNVTTIKTTLPAL